jgi:hypothetical protein
LRHQQTQARAEARECAVEREVTEAHADHAAEQKPMEARAVKAVAQRMREGAEDDDGEREAAEIRAHDAERADAAVGEDDRQREEKRGEEGAGHRCER